MIIPEASTSICTATIMGATATIAVFLSLTLSAIAKHLKFWSKETEKMQTAGYLGAKPGAIETRLLRVLFALKGIIESVEIKIVGQENFPSGRCIIVANHVDLGDTDVLSAIVGTRAGRFLITAQEVPPNDPEGIVMAMAGAIPVQMNSKIAKVKALRAACKALVNDGPNALLAIFPQGQLDIDETIAQETFKTGAAEIARMAAAECETAISIVPVGIHYKRDKNKVPFLHMILKKAFNFILPNKRDGGLFFSESKYAAIAVIGQPLKISPDAPSDRDNIQADKTTVTARIYEMVKAAHELALLA